MAPGPRGIAANTVARRTITTDFCGGMVRDSPEINKRIAEMTALGRAGVPDDIGPIIASLARPQKPSGLPTSTLKSLEACFSEMIRAT